MGNTSPPVNENSLPAPISPYGASKLCCEGYLSSYANAYKINSITLRFGNVYGKFSSHKQGVINKWIRSSINDKPIEIFGDGKQVIKPLTSTAASADDNDEIAPIFESLLTFS